MRWFLLVILMVSSASTWADDFIASDSPRWHIDAKDSSIDEYLDRQSLFLVAGMALDEDLGFVDGVIQYDVAFSEGPSFAGALWRAQDQMNCEQVSLRPHLSGNPDANQYTP